MTGNLHTLLHDQADGVDFATPDVEALVRAGDRRVRRRRTAVVAGVAAAAVVAVTLVSQVLPGSRQAVPEPAGPTYPVQVRDEQPIFTIGSLVVDGDQRVRMERAVDSLVRTQPGWVYRSGTRIYSYVDGVTVQLSGRASTGALASDQDGVLAAWEEGNGAAARIAVVDLRSGEVTRLDVEVDGIRTDSSSELELHDIDGDVVYWRDDRGGVAHDLATGDQRLLEESDVMDVENGVVVWSGARATEVTSPSGTVALEGGDVGVLSPDGAWYAADDVVGFFGRPGFADTRTGRATPFDTGATRDDYVEVAGWLDATTVSVALIAKADDAPDRLLTCTVPAGTCTTVVTDVAAYSDERGVGRTFPGGGHL